MKSKIMIEASERYEANKIREMSNSQKRKLAESLDGMAHFTTKPKIKISIFPPRKIYICPDCGNELDYYYEDNGWPVTMNWKLWTCNHCDYKIASHYVHIPD